MSIALAETLPRRGPLQGTKSYEDIDAHLTLHRARSQSMESFTDIQKQFEPLWMARKPHASIQRRQASHAGSWYPDLTRACRSQIENCLSFARLDSIKVPSNVTARAIITPHAGFSHSGKTAAYAFKHMDTSRTKRVFVLAPSHQFFTTRCCFTCAHTFETPLGNISIDKQVINDLMITGAFDWLKIDVDEDEHAIEMQLPFIAHMMQGQEYTLVPILVGQLSYKLESTYAKLLAPYFADPQNFFIMSSDFCHFGSRFGYCYFDRARGEPWQWVERLDAMAMESIETLDPQKFAAYMSEYKNSICGRNVIGILLNLMNLNRRRMRLVFNRYQQSNKCKTLADASVSYVSAIVYDPADQPPPRTTTALPQSPSDDLDLSGDWGDASEVVGGGARDVPSLFRSTSPPPAVAPASTNAPNTPSVQAYAKRREEREVEEAAARLRLAEWTHLQQALSESPGAHDASTDFEPRVAGEHGDSPRVLSDMKFKVAAPPQGSYGATALAKAPPELSAVASFASSAHVIVPVAQGGANQSKSSSGLKRFVTPAQASKQQTATSFTSVTIAYRSLPPLLWARVLEFLPMQVVLRTVAMLNRDFAKGVEFDLQPLRQSFELRSCGRPNIVEEAIEHCGLHSSLSMQRLSFTACAGVLDSHVDRAARILPNITEWSIDGCSLLTDDGLLAALALGGSQLKAFRLAHMVGSKHCTELPLQVLFELLSAPTSSSSHSPDLLSLHLVDLPVNMLGPIDQLMPRLLSCLPACLQELRLERGCPYHIPLHAKSATDADADVAARERREQFAATLAATQLSQRYGDEFDDLLVLDKTTSSQMARAAAQVDEFRHTLPAAAAASVALTPSESTLASSVFALSFTQIPISGGSGVNGGIGAVRAPAWELDSTQIGADFVTDRCLEALQKLSSQSLQRLSLAGMSSGWRVPQMLHTLRALPRVDTLNLSRCSQVTDSLIAALARNVGRRLRSLSIANCPNMTDAALVFLSLSYCPRLEEIDLTGNHNLSAKAIEQLRTSSRARVRTHAAPGIVW